MQRSRLIALVVSILTTVVLLGGGSAPAQADEERAVTVSGRVTDAEQRPVAGLSVVDRGGRDQTVTAADGTYTLRATPEWLSGQFYAVCFSGGWSRSPRDADRLYASGCHDLGYPEEGARLTSDVTVVRNGRYEGTVTDVEGRAVAGAQVEVCRFVTVDPFDAEGGLSNVATTDARGHYSVVVPAGRVTFEWSKPGYLVDRLDSTGSCTGEREYEDDVSTFVSPGDSRTGLDRVLTRENDVVKSVHRPYVAGTPNVGWTLSARPGSWDPKDATITYRWRVSEDPNEWISSESSFVPTPDLEGRTLVLDVTASKLGKVATTRSIDVGVVRTPSRPAAAITSVHRPYAVGTPRAGWTLSARPGTWSVEPTTVSYRWTIGGATVSRAATFRPTAAQRGKAVRLTATATRPGWRTGTRTVTVGTVR